MGMQDYRFALEFRDELQKLVKAEVEKNRPRYQMATVTAIDRINRKCTVQFPGEAGTAVVNMGSIQPASIGQVVRIEGLLGDRYVADVMGAPYEYVESRLAALESNPQVTSNICTNHSFEAGMESWGDFWQGGTGTHTLTIDTNPANAYAGNNSAKVNLVGDNSNYMTVQHAEIAVVPGEVLFFSWREKIDAGGTNVSTNGEIIVGPDAANANYFGTGSQSLAISAAQAVTSTTYVTRSGYVTIPAGKFFGRFAIRVNSTGTVNTNVRFDDVKFQRVLLQANPTDPVNFGGLVTFSDGASFSSEDSLQGTGWRRDIWSLRTQGLGFHGGGIRNVTSAGISWSARFLSLGFGRESDVAAAGHFQIDMPADSTVITGVGGASNATVAAGLIPLAGATALFYIPPFGNIQTSVPGNLRLVSWGTDFVVPNSWVLIAIRIDGGLVLWGDGREQDYWRAPTLGNSWVNYGSTWDTAGYKRDAGIVYLKGLIKNGTNAAAIFTLPAGYRPVGDNIFTGVSNLITTGAASAGTAHTHGVAVPGTRIDIFASTGVVWLQNTASDNAFLSLAGVSFPAAN